MAKRLPLPGEILREAFMAPLDLNVSRLAKALGVPPTRVSTILAGRRGITTDTALRLARYFSTSPEFWLNVQMARDLEIARRRAGRDIAKAVRPHKRTTQR